jgi:hypothetical protein
MKDAYYFPHDYNAKDDPKCIQLIEEMGAEGYGIFWILIETLRSQSDYMAPLSILSGMARRYNTTPEKMKNVVAKFGLFTLTKDEMFFFSESFLRRMQTIDEKRKKLSEAGKKGNSIRWESPPNRLAIATQSQVKERKEKKSKEKESVNTHEGDKFLDELETDARDKIIMQYLSTTVLSQSEKEVFILRIASNNYCKFVGGTYHRIKISQLRPEAEYCKKQGWLEIKVNTNKPEQQKIVDGGVFQ